MASWRLARSLEALRSEVNNRAPGRSKASDGTVGDLKHSKRRSEHNPNAAGVVTAIDLTHDPAGGLDCHDLAGHLVRRAASGDARVWYIIWNGRIFNVAKGEAWRPYTGPNPHTKHLHLSVSQRPELYDLGTPWDWTMFRLGQRVLRKGMRGPRDVAEFQLRLNAAALTQPVKVDDDFGSQTDRAVRACQHRLGLKVDGVVGPVTLSALEDPLAALTPDEQRELLALARRPAAGTPQAVTWSPSTGGWHAQPIPPVEGGIAGWGRAWLSLAAGTPSSVELWVVQEDGQRRPLFGSDAGPFALTPGQRLVADLVRGDHVVQSRGAGGSVGFLVEYGRSA